MHLAQALAAAAASSRSTPAEVSPYPGGSGVPSTPTRLTPFQTGGKHFSRDLQPVDADGNQISMWSKDARDKANGDEDESSEEESSEEDSEEDSDDAGASKDETAGNRDDRKQQKKARKEAAIAKAKAKSVEVGDMPSSDESDEEEDDDMPANPNHSKAARKQAAKPIDDEVEELAEGVGKIQAGNRKEREALEAAAAKERYMKLQAQGKTDDAKADLARLKVIREQRAAEAARRQVSYRMIVHRPAKMLTRAGREGGERRAGQGAEGGYRGSRGQEARSCCRS